MLVYKDAEDEDMASERDDEEADEDDEEDDSLRDMRLGRGIGMEDDEDDDEFDLGNYKGPR